MNIHELEFCEEYEDKLDYFNLLECIKDNLSQKGKEEYNSLKIWLDKNLVKYLSITGNQ